MQADLGLDLWCGLGHGGSLHFVSPNIQINLAILHIFFYIYSFPFPILMWGDRGERGSDSHRTKQFAVTSGVSYNLTQFWYSLSGDGTWFQKVRAQLHCPHPTLVANHKSRLSSVLLFLLANHTPYSHCLFWHSVKVMFAPQTLGTAFYCLKGTLLSQTIGAFLWIQNIKLNTKLF